MFRVREASPEVLVLVKVNETSPELLVVPAMVPASEPLLELTAPNEVPPLDHVAFEPLYAVLMRRFTLAPETVVAVPCWVTT